MRAGHRPLLLGTATAAAVLVALVTPGTAGAVPAPSPSASTATKSVIVLLKNQHTSLPNTKADRARRMQALGADQAPVVAKVRQLGAKNVSTFKTINAVAAALTPSAIDQLEADPAVASVVPDLPISKPAATLDQVTKAAAASAPGTGCTTDPAKPLLEPEALQTMHVAYNDSTVGAQNYTTGQGVTVAYIADGVDINNPDFMRNGKSVFTDYQDFTTEGLDAPSSSAEAFGDASSIAAQGNQTYDISNWVNTAHAIPPGCTIKIRGVAPGANLVGLKVYGSAPTAPTSRFVQAIEYAVNVDNVDVLNESFGANPYPDSMTDPISLADDAAIAAGVTVVSSTGDSGETNTIGSPASSPGVIGVGATTQYRSYAQTTASGFQLPGVKGYTSNEISAISSAGFAQNGKVPDVVAPGDLGWALCTANPAIYTDCTDANGNPANFQDFGGTSQSSPLTAGTAALVISAYEKAHPGAGRPSPALVKRIITSTAQDLGHPAQLQGSGEVDALAAVRAAMSVPAEGTTKRPASATGTALLVDKTQLDLAGKAGSTVSATVHVTNISPATQTIKTATRSLTSTSTLATGTVNFAGSTLPTFVDDFGTTRAYTSRIVTVPSGADRLDASITWASSAAIVRVLLVSPKGIYTDFSIPQGLGNYAHVDARYPAAGKWTVYMYANPTFSGPVGYLVTSSKYGKLGTVSPSATTIAAGKTVALTYSVKLPANPADTAASIQVTTALGLTVSVPVSLRGTIPTSAGTSVFHGTITGGNGRDAGGTAVTKSYYLDVPSGAPNLSIGVTFPGPFSDPAAIYNAFLTDPNGQPMSAKANVQILADGSLDTSDALQMYVNQPISGRWRLVIEAVDPVAGDTLVQPFTGYVSLASEASTVKATLPNSGKVTLKAGSTTLVKVKVTNNGVMPLSYFTDARYNFAGDYTLASQVPGDDLSDETLPLPNVYAQWLVPTHSSSITMTGDATEPIQLDAGWNFGGPELLGASTGNKSSVTISAPKIAQGPWYAQAGPIGPGPAPDGSVAYTASVHTKVFDSFVTSTTGDFWINSLIPAPAADTVSSTKPGSASLSSTHWRNAAKAQATSAAKATPALAASGPLTLQPGQSGFITVAVSPTAAAKGKLVTGKLFIDTFEPFLGTGDEVVGLPYSYKVG